MSEASTRSAWLPYSEIEDDFLPPRDPIVGYVKIGGKDSTVRYTAAGKPWVGPTRFVDPARFEVTTREKKTETVNGKKGSEGQTFKLDRGYVRDVAFHARDGVGEEPDLLRVRLLYPHWSDNLIAFLGAYSGSGWVCRGNGVEAIDTKRGECFCPCPRLKQFSGKYEGTPPNDGRGALHPCKPHGQLNMILEDAELFGGFWAFKTTSFETISNLTKSLRMFEEMFGRIDGLPLELRVMAATKKYDGGTTTQPIVTLVLPASMSTARQVAADAAAEARKFLPAGRELDEETYREAIVSEMQEEAASYAREYLPVEVERELEQEEDGPELEEERADEEPPLGAAAAVHKCRTCGGTLDSGGTCRWCKAGRKPPVEDEVEEPTSEEEADPDDSDRNDPEKLVREVLKAAGWPADAIDGRVAHHVKMDTLDELLDRVARHAPEAWAKVMALEIFGTDDEPDDGLAS